MLGLEKMDHEYTRMTRIVTNGTIVTYSCEFVQIRAHSWSPHNSYSHPGHLLAIRIGTRASIPDLMENQPVGTLVVSVDPTIAIGPASLGSRGDAHVM